MRYFRRIPPSLLRLARREAIFWAASCRSAIGMTNQYRRAGRVFAPKTGHITHSIAESRTSTPRRGCDNRGMDAEQSIRLTAVEARVLGALVEKEVTTPEYYPLSLNALINACNQRSNREPVLNLDEDDARQALHALESKGLAGRARSADGRVTKYEHWLGEAFNFSRAETALICVLLLRGPQTPGELRGRTERMHRFDEITDVLAGLQKLAEREP